MAAITSALTILYNHQNSPDLVQQIADEVVTNHIKLKPMEIQSANFATVKGYFNLLGFSPIRSTQFNLDTKTLLGGRYCSIKSAPAAQFRYSDEAGNLHTSYQTGYEAELFSDIQILNKEALMLFHYAKGLVVNIWLGHRLLIASVSDTTLNFFGQTVSDIFCLEFSKIFANIKD